MAAETPDKQYGFTIDGELYEEPESLTVADHRIIKRYTGLNFRDLAAQSSDAMYVDQDGIAAILHIAYRHQHEDMSFDEINAIIERQDFDAAMATLESADEVEDDAGPPELTRPPAGSSPSEPSSTQNEPASSNKNSGVDSTTSSDLSDANPATTGTGESDTFSPESDLETAEALAS